MEADMSFSKLMELINLAKKCGLDQVEWFIRGLESLSLRWNENLYKKLLDTCLYNSHMPLLNTTFPAPITKDELAAVDGPYKIGIIEGTSIELGFTSSQIQMHGLIGGGAGYGKSSLVKILCQQILTEGKKHIWIIDPKGEGGDFRFLARDFDVLLLRPDTIRCNPFTAIPNVPRDMLRELVCEVTADSFGVYDASEGIMAKHTQRIFERYQEPTLHDFIASIQTEKGSVGGRKQGYLDSLDTRLTKAQISLGKIIDCKSDYFSELYNKSVIFEIGELSGSAQRVLIPWLILKLVLYKIKNQTQQLSHLLVFDEAQANLFSRELFENRGRTSFMATLATQCRAFGLGILVLAQNPCMKLIREIIANSCIKVCFQLGSGEEVLGMSRHMGLTPEQMEAIYHLDRQEVICRVGLGFTEPMRVRVNDFPDQPITNAELAEIMKDSWKELLEGIEPARPDSNRIIKSPKAHEQKPY
jgi:DNA helicase HerA-like ATPase